MMMDFQEQVNSLSIQVRELLSQGRYEEALGTALMAREMAHNTLGENHPAYADSVRSLAVVYRMAGDYASAEPLFAQALEITRYALGENHRQYAVRLNELAELYRELGRLKDAEPLYRQALNISQTIHGEKHTDTVSIMNNLGLLYKDQGDYPAALKFLQQALFNLSEGEEARPVLAMITNNLADVRHTMGDYAKAESLYLQSLELRRVVYGEDSPTFATALGNLGSLYLDTGNYPEAQSLLEKALAIRRAVLGEGNPAVAVSLRGLAELHWKLGNYPEARRLIQRTLSIYRRAFGEDHPEVAANLDNLAYLDWSMGDNARAQAQYQLAGKIMRKIFGPMHPYLAIHLNQFAQFYAASGNYDSAEKHYRQALKIARSLNLQTMVATISNNLAHLFRARGDFGKALPLLRDALEIRRRELGEKHPDFAQSLDNLMAITGLLDPEAAEPLLRQALQIKRAAFGEHHPETAYSLNNLAFHYYFVRGDYDMAEQLYLQSLEARQRSTGKNHPEYTQVLSNLAILYAAMDRTAQALERMDEAATIEDGLIGQIFVLGSERQRMNYLNAFQMDYYAYISLVLNYASNDPSAKRAVFELVLRRKAIGLEALAAQQDAVLGGRYPHLSSKLHALTMLRRQIAQKTLEGPGSGGAEAHQALLAEWDTQREGLEEELARQIPEMNLEQKLRATDLQTVAKSIPSGAALVEFVRFDDINFTAVFSKGGSLRRPSRYLAFVLSGDERENIQMFDLGEAEPIEQRIAKFRKSIAGGDRHLLLAEQGTRHLLPGNQRTRRVVQAEDGAILRAAVFDPLLPALGDIKRVFLAPDGDLTRLPFEVLPVDGGQCLIDAYQFMYLSTGRDLLSLDMASPHEPDSAIVAAAPDFDLGHKEADMSSEELGHPGRQSRDLDQESALFLPLPGTRLEGEQISGLLDVHPLLGVDVLESRLKASRSPRILHIATHGFFLEDQERDRDQDFGTRGADDRLGHLSRLENPLLRSGLALAGANTWLAKRALVAEAEDGIMTAEDVSGLDLLATELVVLSACETGLGEVQVGEGVFGLRRAFVLAGAKTLVMSLWKVPDQQTQELMVDFYQRILQGQPRAKALREAQLAMKAKHPDPLYWGAFICQGDPSPLPQSG